MSTNAALYEQDVYAWAQTTPRAEPPHGQAD